MIDYTKFSRSFRAHVGLTESILWMMPTVERIRLQLAVNGYKLTVPQDVEAARRDGWCLVDTRMGYAAKALEVPLNLRDAGGTPVGEVVAFDSRGGDLWALLLWRRDGEELESFAARVRVAGILRDVPCELGAGVVVPAEAA